MSISCYNRIICIENEGQFKSPHTQCTLVISLHLCSAYSDQTDQKGVKNSDLNHSLNFVLNLRHKIEIYVDHRDWFICIASVIFQGHFNALERG